MRAVALLVQLQRLIEATYDLDTGVDDLTPYIIGDEGYGRFYAGRPVHDKVRAPAPSQARTLVRQSDGALRLAIYYPDSMVAHLEAENPAAFLADSNVDAFAVLVEELDHFLTLADRHRTGADMSLLELELHANVTKQLTLELFLAKGLGRSRLGGGERAWVRHHLFGKLEFREEDPEVQSRYRDAAALAVRYLDYLRTVSAPARPVELRRFHRRTHHQKLAHISRLA